MNDGNDYTLGRKGKHNFVVAVLPLGEYRISSATIVAKTMLLSFPNIRIGLLVGIRGGAPSLKHDIRLGDVVVSVPSNGKGGVFQYDFGKTIQGRAFEPTGSMNQPPDVLLTAINGLDAQYQIDGHNTKDAVENFLNENRRLRRSYQQPDQDDKLHKSDFTHENQNSDCFAWGGDLSPFVSRHERSDLGDDPMIHYGIIASASGLMNDALIRDQLAKENNVLCFETEAAGLMNRFPLSIHFVICCSRSLGSCPQKQRLLSRLKLEIP